MLGTAAGVAVRVVMAMRVPAGGVIGMRVAVPMRMTVSVVVSHHGVVAVGAAFGFEGFADLGHRHVHGAQHVGQHMVGLDFQVVRLQLDRHMPVAQVVGGAHQVKGAAVLGAGGDAQHGLRRGFDTDERAVFGHQHIATAHHVAAWQKHAQGTSGTVGGVKAAFLAGVPVQGDGVGALNQHAGQTATLRHEFGAKDHQNKK